MLVNGRPFALPWIVDNVPALLEAWLPGEEGGEAIADVLFGDANPGGKLPVTVPRSVGQVPLFYAHRPSGARSFFYGPYVDESNEPLFPFGYGLSYTKFTVRNLRLSPASVEPSGYVEVRVEVANTGDMAGDEVVQFYTRTVGASVTRPVLELRGFQRVELTPGEAKTVTFSMPVTQMSYYDLDMRRVVEPVDVEVLVGTSAQDLPLRGGFRIAGGVSEVADNRPMFTRVSVD